MFAGSIILRWVAAGWVRKIREPNALPVKHVMGEILGGLPWRPLLFPIGLYRSVSEAELTGEPSSAQPPRPKLLDRGEDRKSRELTGHRQG
jgi:hypothetical protein